MRKLKRILAVAFAFPLLFACNNKSLKLDQDNIKIEWVAYKTTDKVPVAGTFKQVKLENLQEGLTAEEVLNGATFSIPVSSLFSDNADRDTKLKQLFFGMMKNTELISGKFMYAEKDSKLAVTMNGVTREIPVQTVSVNNTFKLKGTLHLSEFEAQEAMDSLNKACYDLHMGADGISKTWEEVAIEGVFSFKQPK